MRELTVSKLKKNNLVAQANTLIEARYSITKNEQILLFAMISLINPKDKEFLTFSVDYRHLAEILDIDKKSALRELELVIARLMSRVLKIDTPTGWIMYQWVSRAKLENNIITLKFHDDLKPYLLALRKSGNFTQTRLGIAVSFKSLYTIRIYQLLREYYSKNYRDFEFSLEKFRNMVLGEKSKTHPIFKNFRRHVLNVAKKELETIDKDTGLYKSDLSFDLETRRTGRKISHLKFIIKKQKTAPVKQLQIDIPEQNPYQNTPEYRAMLELAISETHALSFMEQYGTDYIAEKLQVLAERQKIEDVISPSGLFINALKEDRKSEKLAKQKKEQEQRAREEEKRRLEQLERKKHDLIIQFGKVVKKEFFASLSKNEESQLLEELKEEYEAIDDFFKLEELNKNGLKSLFLGADITKRIPDYTEKKEAYIKANLKK